MSKKTVTRNGEKLQEAHIYFPVEFYAKLKDLAKKERRTLNGQILLMLEKQIAKESL